MAYRRVTMQDIADACGLSRNTVSKVFNDRGFVQEKTRQLVLNTAQELGFFPLADEKNAAEDRGQNVALLTSRMPTNYHFGTLFIPAFAGQLSRAGYTLRMYELTGEELARDDLVSLVSLDQTVGIVAIEVFDRKAIRNISRLGLPTIFVDDCYGAAVSVLEHDRISMENMPGVITLVEHVIARGAKKLGFVGDPEHCNSFYERWYGFNSALSVAGIPLERAFCILDPDDSPYGDVAWLTEKLRRMPRIPDALICVNDFVAIHVMAALKQMGLSIPDQVMVTGFDGTAQSAVVEPGLTTVQIPGDDIGRVAADVLLNRLTHPDRPFISVYVKTVPILRGSTNKEKKGAVNRPLS